MGEKKKALFLTFFVCYSHSTVHSPPPLRASSSESQSSAIRPSVASALLSATKAPQRAHTAAGKVFFSPLVATKVGLG